MTFMHDLADIFDEAFGVYEKNRMYPPGHRKESPMKKLTVEHLATIEKAIGLLRLRHAKQPIPRFRKQIHADIKRMYEIGYYVKDYLTEPMFSNLQDEPTHLNP